MLGVKVTILRYISDDPQPGIVECQLGRRQGQSMAIHRKTRDCEHGKSGRQNELSTTRNHCLRSSSAQS